MWCMMSCAKEGITGYLKYENKFIQLQHSAWGFPCMMYVTELCWVTSMQWIPDAIISYKVAIHMRLQEMCSASLVTCWADHNPKMAGYHQLRHLLTRSLVTSSTSRLAPRYLITGGMGQLGPELAKNLRYLCSYIGMIINYIKYWAQLGQDGYTAPNSGTLKAKTVSFSLILRALQKTFFFKVTF